MVIIIRTHAGFFSYDPHTDILRLDEPDLVYLGHKLGNGHSLGELKPNSARVLFAHITDFLLSTKKQAVHCYLDARDAFQPPTTDDQ